jgi:flagellar hook-associated protein 2
MSSAISSSAGSVTSTGIGSGLNINAIVQSLTAAYGAAQQNNITAQEDSLNAQVSAFGTFSNALSTLQATLATLENPGTLAGFATSVADQTIASATADSTAVAGSYTLEVQNLATAGILTSGPQLTAATPIGTGTLTISVGGASTTINIDATDNTLSGIAAAINGATGNPGISASILTTTAGARLVLSGTATGTANAVTVTESDAGTGLAPLVSTLTQTQAAADANFTINNFAATSASNVVTTAIGGVTLNLLGKSAASTPTTLSITPDTSTAQTSIETFVTAVNGVLSAIQSLTGYDPTSQTAGPLNGNAALQTFQSQLENILDSFHTAGTSSIHSLADLGVSVDAQTGALSGDGTTLGNALNASLAGVGNLLGGKNGIATQIDALIKSYTGPAGLLSSINQGLETGLKNVNTEQAQLNSELAAYAQTLTVQYNAMDAAVAALKEMQTFLTAEFNPNQATSSSTGSANTGLGSGNLNTGG